MQANHAAWDQEYRRQTFLTNKPEPQAAVRKFLKWWKKENKKDVSKLAASEPSVTPAQERQIAVRALDLGCGTGRNANWLARQGFAVVAYDIAPTALEIARKQARELGVEDRVEYKLQDISNLWPLENNSIDLVLDVTSSNSLTAPERDMYLSELQRVMKPGSHLFLRTLCKEGDKNAKQLLKDHPANEPDMYTLPELGITERVFTESDLRQTYKNLGEFIDLKKVAHYPRFGERVYKRQYWIGYLQMSV